MSDVFISYSRKDKEFARELHRRLAEKQQDVWIDWEDIPPSAEWIREIDQGIEAADTFVFVVSPDSIASQTCRHEVQHAATHQKRIMPVVILEPPHSDVPDVLSRVNWLFFRDEDEFTTSFNKLLGAINTDLPWTRAHTRLLVRAREWEMNQKDSGYLLMGKDLNDAEAWMADSSTRNPAPTVLQSAYVAASRQGTVRLQKNQLRGFYIISMIYATAQTVVSYLVVFDEISEKGLMFLSPLWVLGLVFGGFGFTLGRTSLKRTIIATGIAALGLYLFFAILWPFL
jgi:hypothetical protein